MSRMQTAPAPQTQYRDESDPDFKRLLNKDTRSQKVYADLCSREQAIEEMLPYFMKGQAKRLMRRAVMYMNDKRRDLADCPDSEFIRIVVEAASLGFALDGRMVYVVKYKSNFQLVLDYKAMVAVAKRNRTIVDIDADIVCQNDRFEAARRDGKCILNHSYDLLADRGECIGAFARVFLPGGGWNYAIMNRAELDKVQAVSKAKYDGRPWDAWEGEMQKKTVIRRALKLYQDDPGVMRMLEVTAWEDDAADEPKPQPRTIDELGKRLTMPKQQPMARGEIPLDTPDEPESHDRPQTADSDSNPTLEALKTEVSQANAIGDVETIRVAYTKRAKDDGERFDIDSICKERVEAIRASRGENSNKNAK